MGERPAAVVCLPRASRTRFGATGCENGPVEKLAVAKIGERDGWRRAVWHAAGWRGGGWDGQDHWQGLRQSHAAVLNSLSDTVAAL